MKLHEKTVNEGHHQGTLYEIAQLEAAGYQWPDSAKWGGTLHPEKYKTTQAKFNGGIVSPIESRLQKGDKIYRFADSKLDFATHMGGRWWFDYDTCLALYKHSGTGLTDEGFRRAARAGMAVLYEWGDMGKLVTGVLNHDFWAIKGCSAPAYGKRNGEKINNPYGLDVLQMFVPGGFKKEHFTDIKYAALTRLKY